MIIFFPLFFSPGGKRIKVEMVSHVIFLFGLYGLYVCACIFYACAYKKW